ncbi:hypothetical protein JTB14_005251 [Gonioctena quinquepunctata]|nr:hypothetical protein JTB14_005251 [Gonioctena quinquepunctata]
MQLLKNLADVPLQEQIDFINSFDDVLTDMDGVLWVQSTIIPDGAPECIDTLKKFKKKVFFVTNLALATVEQLWKKLKHFNYSANFEDIVNPLLGVIDYLKENNVETQLYVVGSYTYKNELRKAGFVVAPDPPQIVEETAAGLLQYIADDKNIGAVIFDYDPNVTWVKLQKCITYLKRKDCLFISGTGEKYLPYGSIGPLIGNHYNLQGLKELSGRESYHIAKPSIHYNEFFERKFGITNPKRVLFIGDSINEDMGTAALGRYQKLLVLTGTATKKDLSNWKYPEEYKPEYYVESMGVFNNILKSIDVHQV